MKNSSILHKYILFTIFCSSLFLLSEKCTASFSTYTLAGTGVAVGSHTSIAIDGAGNIHVSYYDGENGDLKYARWNGTSWSISTVDSVGDVGQYNSIAIDAWNNPHISYWSASALELKYASYTGTQWNSYTVDPLGGTGLWTSLAIDFNGKAHIAYYFRNPDKDLKYALWQGSFAAITTVDSVGDLGEYTSLALDVFGNPHISYYDASNFDLRYASYTGTAWSTNTVASAGNVGQYTSMVLNGVGNPLIAYYDVSNSDLKIASLTAAGWNVQTVDGGGAAGDNVGEYGSLALDGSGQPHLAYYDATNFDLKYASWTGTAWSTNTLDATGTVGLWTSIVLDANGRPHISYFDQTNIDIKIASWTEVGYARPIGGNARSRVQAPSGFGALALSSSTLSMAWTDNAANETAYRLYGTTFAVPIPPPPPAPANYLVNSFNPGTNAYTEGNLLQEATYFRYIAAVNAGGIVFSSAVIVKMPDTTPPAKSTFWASCRVGSLSIQLNWCPPGDDSTVGNLIAGSQFLIQYSSNPAAVTWSTANAQSVISAEGTNFDPNCAVVISSSIVVNSTEPFFFRHWTRDESGNYSLWSAATAYTILTDFSNTTVIDGDSTVHVGSFTSLAVDAFGNMHVSYFDGSNHTLKYAKKASGGSWIAQTVDNSGHVGRYSSLAVDGSGNPHIAYHDRTLFELKYAKWTGSAWTTERVDIAGVVGEYAAIALDGAGHPHISYYDTVFGDLKYARWTGTAWSTVTVDTGGDVGQYTSIAVDALGNPHISYYDANNGDLKYASMTVTGWNTQSVDTGGNVGRYTSIALDGSGYPHISYEDVSNASVNYTKWTGSAWTKQRVTTETVSGKMATSIALDGDSKPYIAFYAAGGFELFLAKWDGVLWSTQPAAPCWNGDLFNSFAIDQDGNPQITFFNDYFPDLTTRIQQLRISYLTSANYARPMGGNARGKVQAPTSLTATGRTTTSITWSWTDNSNNETNFKIYGATSSGGPFSLIATLGSGTTTYSESDLSSDFNYYRYVAAFNAGGMVTSSATVSSPIENKLPNAISNLTALQGPTTGQITLTWTAPGDDGTVGNIVGGFYRIKYSDLGVIRSADFDGTATSIDIATDAVPGETVAIVLSGLDPGTTYFFAIKTQDDSGNWSLWNSSADVAAVNTLASNWPMGVPPPQTNLQPTITSLKRCTLSYSWTSIGSTASYKAVLSTMSNFSVLIQSGTETTNDITYSTGISAGTTYYFRVKISSEVDVAYSTILSSVTLPEVESFVSTGGVYNVGESDIQIPAGALVTIGLTCAGTGFHLISSTEVMTVTYSNGFSVSFSPGVEVNVTPTSNGLTLTSTASVTIDFEGVSLTPSSGTTAVSVGSPLNVVLDTRTAQNLQLTLPANYARAVIAELTHPLSPLKIEFPTGTFTESVSIQTKLPDSLPSQNLASGETKVEGTGIGLEVNLNKNITLAKTVGITMSYKNVAAAKPDILNISRFDESNERWMLLPATLNRSAQTVTAQTPRFSKFQLLSVLPADNVNDGVAYPNPLRFPLGHEKMIFTKLSANASIKIYTYLGELVAELKADDKGQAEWLGINRAGEKVMSGVYVVLIEGAAKSQKILKIAVER